METQDKATSSPLETQSDHVYSMLDRDDNEDDQELRHKVESE